MVRKGGGSNGLGNVGAYPLSPCGSMTLVDFVSIRAWDRRFRILAIFDGCTRECLAAIADTSLSGGQVAREPDCRIVLRGKPVTIVSDNGTELTRNAILSWADQSQDGTTSPRQADAERLRRKLQWPACGTSS